MTKLFTAAAVALVSLATAAGAAAPEAGRSTIVRYADLDLASADGQAALQRRMHHAVDLVCGRAFDGDLRAHLDRMACREEAQASADRGVQQAMLTRSGRVQVAAIGPSGR